MTSSTDWIDRAQRMALAKGKVGPLASLRGIWRGRTVACIASGPSLTAEDCELIRRAGLPTIVVNTSFRLAPWADILFAMDAGWWQHYGEEAHRVFAGKKFSYVRVPGVQWTKGDIFPTGWGNSGSYAISMAVVAGAASILLLGYDCQVVAGRAHWHADHPPHLGNARTIAQWPYRFSLIATYAKSHHCRVINCSRATALDCFERSTLDAELAEARAA